MKRENEIIIGNVTTIINSLSLAIAGIIFGIIGAFGLKLPLDQYGLSAIIGLLISTAFAYINAKYHCTFFDKDEDTLTINTSNLDDAQVTAIQNFIEEAVKLNLKNELEISEVEDL